MAAEDIILSAVKWGSSVLTAAETKAQKRAANVLERAALLAAGMRYLDRRFVELFMPLTFYDPGIWPLERRREHSEAILDFIYRDRVISDIRQAITWLDNSPTDDRHVQILVESLCEVVRIALWPSESADLTSELPSPIADEATWADDVRAVAWDQIGDVDDYAAPAVKRLVDLLRTDAPSPAEIRQAASCCLVPPVPMRVMNRRIPHSRVVQPLAEPNDQDDRIGMAGAVSPLRTFADHAGERFQELLAVTQGSFPAIPTPTWMYSG